MGSSFDSVRTTVLSFKYISSLITEILENVKVFARRRHRQGYDNTDIFFENSRADKNFEQKDGWPKKRMSISHLATAGATKNPTEI